MNYKILLNDVSIHYYFPFSFLCLSQSCSFYTFVFWIRNGKKSLLPPWIPLFPKGDHTLNSQSPFVLTGAGWIMYDGRWSQGWSWCLLVKSWRRASPVSAAPQAALWTCAVQQLELDTERLLLNHKRHRDSWPLEEKNSIQGQRRGLITQSFCVIKFYSSIKEIEKASDIDIRRAERIPTC